MRMPLAVTQSAATVMTASAAMETSHPHQLSVTRPRRTSRRSVKQLADHKCEIRAIHVPFPTARLARVAITALAVDKELSPAVRRAFSLVPDGRAAAGEASGAPEEQRSLANADAGAAAADERSAVLRVNYRATTNRMLRVAVNGFFLSLAVVVQCMEELDVDVAMDAGSQSLDGVQGLAEVKVRE